MITAAIALSILLVAYCLAVAIYAWAKRGSDRIDQLLHDEHRAKSDRGVVASALAARNPAYRFRRYSVDAQLVTRVAAPSASALADKSR
jgi:hypothetical protein